MAMRVLKAVAAALGLAAVAGAPAPAAVPTIAQAAVAPRVEGPITGGKRGYPYSASIVDLKPYGYSEAEYFIAGRAHPFVPAPGTTLGADGRWRAVAGPEQAYKTRMLVRKPPAARFNGTVVIEVMQEYYGTERDTNYRWNAEALLREGFGWVGLSLHHEGIDDRAPQQSFTYGGQTVTTGLNLLRWDPERYASLSVPSSDLSFDILAQVGRALHGARWSGGPDPFAGLRVRKVIAVGNTIAAERLAIYIDAVQPLAPGAIDGFFLQDFSPGKLQLSTGVATPSAIRTDVKVPVIVLDTTTGAMRRGPRPEGPMLRYWDPAGSSHTTGESMVRVAAANRRDLGMDGGFCPVDVANNFPVQYVSSAAIVAVDRWAKGGAPAASFPQLQPTSVGKDPITAFDAQGNSAGGLRTPWVDVPVRHYEWRSDCPAGSGKSTPLAAAQLRALYGSPEAYRRRFAAAAREAVKRGVLLPQDAEAAIQDARRISW